jgi:D-sedoheptulose 7-phosphate isomerase
MTETADRLSVSQAALYLGELAGILDQVPADAVSEAIALLLETRALGRRVYIMGNGGSASTASHLVCDLVKTARVPGLPPLRAYALGDNTALMTAWANDKSYDYTFAEQIFGLVEYGDVVIAISASGNSPNIVAGLAAAAKQGAHTVALVGFDGGKAGRMADITVHVPSYDYGLVEDSHSAIGHAMTSAVRHALLGTSR